MGSILQKRDSLEPRNEDGIQYTYAVTSYDMGVDADYEVVWNYLTDTLLIDTT